jgi:hypothetical protein
VHLASTIATHAAPPQHSPNVVVIDIDDMGYARTMRWMETDCAVNDDPYRLVEEAAI